MPCIHKNGWEEYLDLPKFWRCTGPFGRHILCPLMVHGISARRKQSANCVVCVGVAGGDDGPSVGRPLSGGHLMLSPAANQISALLAHFLLLLDEHRTQRSTI